MFLVRIIIVSVDIIIALVMVFVNLISVILSPFLAYIRKARNEQKRREEEQREIYYNLHSYKDEQD